MARLGDNQNNKSTESGRKYFGSKDIDYLKKLSRDSLEDDQNFSVLFFQLDWDLSKKNFYGELLIKKFKHIKGIPLKASFKIVEGDEELLNSIPNQIMKLDIYCYVEQLKELNIEPKMDDYFGIGQRLYRIYKRTIKDAGPGNLLVNRERMDMIYKCVQDDDETLQKDVFGDNLGLEYQLNPANGDIQTN